MTKEEYIQWKATRAPEAEAYKWEIDDCRAADALIEKVALENATHWTAQNIADLQARLLFNNLLCAHFGSVEVDEFLQHIKAYPEWM